MMSKPSYKRISDKPHDVQWRLYEKIGYVFQRNGSDGQNDI